MKASFLMFFPSGMVVRSWHQWEMAWPWPFPEVPNCCDGISLCHPSLIETWPNETNNKPKRSVDSLSCDLRDESLHFMIADSEYNSVTWPMTWQSLHGSANFCWGACGLISALPPQIIVHRKWSEESLTQPSCLEFFLILTKLTPWTRSHKSRVNFSVSNRCG